MRLTHYINETSVRTRTQTIKVVKPSRDKKGILVDVKTKEFDNLFKQDREMYIGPGGKGGIGDRYNMFGIFVNGGSYDVGGFEIDHDPADSIESAEVHVNDKGEVSFLNGRHRWAWLRDQGARTIPVSMSRKSIENSKKFGLLP